MHTYMHIYSNVVTATIDSVSSQLAVKAKGTLCRREECKKWGVVPVLKKRYMKIYGGVKGEGDSRLLNFATILRLVSFTLRPFYC
jgi:hypothetical protein